MAVTKDSIIKALSTVDDPDFKKDLVTLNMIKDVSIDGNAVYFTVVLTTPACPLKEVIKNDCINAIHKLVNADLQVFPNMTSDVTSTRSSAPLLPNVKNIIAIGSGKGGVGKSTVTANLAVSLAQEGAKVGLIDADIFGPSIPTMFNCEAEQPEVRQVDGKNIIVPIEQYGIKLISIGFLTPPDNAVVWRGPMASSALKQFIGDTDWGELDYLLIDLPPGTSDIHLTLVQTIPVTGAVVVTTPQKVALADAKKAIGMFKQPQINVPILGLVENMAYFTPAELPDNKYFIFGEGGGYKMSEEYKIPFLGQMPLVQSIRESGDSGYPTAMKDGPSADAFKELAQKLARQVAIRNAGMEGTKIVEMTR
ncbi:Mrp/NBP35 family ATP-binding protein [Marivirga harenae]|uniref:Mrp/NBP35 family ATP-binding protein n=1 Tax=Marivirga harenae TaxID=2010992 RepID=UPI0026DEA772|nr:Mrp/NBP35 family ATP-binding protein [Marivirga harenae]WKV11042.1 Mrp/NBP35 family ATP-binding protein [Marivirga harenae]|tara:strand:- start:132951 stop:134045 length:1095 start_codon:yes stop_codon:yes gene_type:complete